LVAHASAPTELLSRRMGQSYLSVMIANMLNRLKFRS
jgi:hypothetical protein